MSYQITHIGAEHTVTGSCHLLQTAGLNIMVDCGLTQGHDVCTSMHNWPVKPSEIDYLFLTHAHIDHIGRLPELIRNGFSGEILCTHPTRALLKPMLNDAMAIAGLSSSETRKITLALDELSWGFEYRTVFDLKKGIRFKLDNAGHILGSCFVRFESVREGWSIVFSGDIGAVDTPILPDPDVPEGCDLLILESTYGNRMHADRAGRITHLGNVLESALNDGGKVYIPAFALGRTQELIYEMDRLFSKPEYKAVFPSLCQDRNIPVFVDSPLGLELTEIYSKLSPFWDDEAKSIHAGGDHPMNFDHLYAVENYHDHIRLMDMPGPALIVAGSGMCTGGRILDHLAAGLENPENDIVFAGYQAMGTLGRQILSSAGKGNRKITIDGRRIDLRAAVHALSGYSAHADQRGLVDWVGSMPEKPGGIKLVHGEPPAQKALAGILKNKGYDVI